MSNHSLYILWLPSWYPCRLTPYDGDFIQRHARAVALFTPVHVIHIIRDAKGELTRDVLVEEHQEGNLRETIIYYHSPVLPLKSFEGFVSFLKYQSIFKKHLADLFFKNGKPELVHVHIAFKAGMIANWIKRQFGVPFLLTEQWTAYLPDAQPSFGELSFAARYYISNTIKQAALILPVSDFLGRTIQARWPSAKYEVVPNVVNENIFYPGDSELSATLKLIHISTLTYQKAPELLFEAAGLLKKRGVAFSLNIIGPATEEVFSMIRKNEIEQEVKCLGEMPQEHLAGYIRQSDALVLYSRYETFGCVLIEANACGVPVIVPDTPLMHELVTEKKNGIFVKPGSADALADAFLTMASLKNSFQRPAIARDTSNLYSYQRVGKLYTDIYEKFKKT
jgi:glycosyltransferase involved in cell wall biosynthesis